MTRQADRRPAEIRLGGPESAVSIADFHRVWGEDGAQVADNRPPTLADDDVMLLPGVSVDGEPPMLGTGPATKIGRIQCACRAVVATIWAANRIHYVEAQLCEDSTVVPPRMVVRRLQLAPGLSLTADCPVHGRQDIPADDVLKTLAGRRHGQFVKHHLATKRA